MNTFSEYINKHCKIIAKDNNRPIFWDAMVNSVDANFLHLTDRYGRNVSIAIETILKIEVVRGGNHG